MDNDFDRSPIKWLKTIETNRGSAICAALLSRRRNGNGRLTKKLYRLVALIRSGNAIDLSRKNARSVGSRSRRARTGHQTL
jgi:hypothetical protein